MSVSTKYVEPTVDQMMVNTIRAFANPDGSLTLKQFKERLIRRYIDSVASTGKDISRFFKPNGNMKPIKEVYEEFMRMFAPSLRVTTIAGNKGTTNDEMVKRMIPLIKDINRIYHANLSPYKRSNPKYGYVNAKHLASVIQGFVKKIRLYLIGDEELTNKVMENTAREVKELRDTLTKFFGDLDIKYIPDQLDERADDLSRNVFILNQIKESLDEQYQELQERANTRNRPNVSSILSMPMDQYNPNEPPVRLNDITDYPDSIVGMGNAKPHGSDIGKHYVDIDDYCAKATSKLNNYLNDIDSIKETTNNPYYYKSVNYDIDSKVNANNTSEDTAIMMPMIGGANSTNNDSPNRYMSIESSIPSRMVIAISIDEYDDNDTPPSIVTIDDITFSSDAKFKMIGIDKLNSTITAGSNISTSIDGRDIEGRITTGDYVGLRSIGAIGDIDGAGISVRSFPVKSVMFKSMPNVFNCPNNVQGCPKCRYPYKYMTYFTVDLISSGDGVIEQSLIFFRLVPFNTRYMDMASITFCLQTSVVSYRAYTRFDDDSGMINYDDSGSGMLYVYNDSTIPNTITGTDNTTTGVNYLVNYLNNVFIDSIEPSKTISINDQIPNNVLGCLLLKLLETNAINPSRMRSSDVVMIRNRIRMYPPGLSLEVMSYTDAINEAFLIPAVTEAINTIAAPRIDVLARESKRLTMYYKDSKLRSMINNEQARMLKNEVQFMNVSTQMKAKLHMLYTRYKVIDRDPDATYVFSYYNKTFNNGIDLAAIIKSNSITKRSDNLIPPNQAPTQRVNRTYARNTVGSTLGANTGANNGNANEPNDDKHVVSADNANDLSNIDHTEYSDSDTAEAPAEHETEPEAPPVHEEPIAREETAHEAPAEHETEPEAEPVREETTHEAPAPIPANHGIPPAHEPAREAPAEHPIPANQANGFMNLGENVFDGIDDIE